MKINNKKIDIEKMLAERAKNKICNYCLHNGEFCRRGIPKYRIVDMCKYFQRKGVKSE